MDQLSAMRIFVVVVESQGFSAASRVLGIPVPTVSRQIANLENKLGVQLLIRSTRKTTVTGIGQRYYDEVKHILDDINNVDRLVTGEYQEVKGLLTITAPAMFGRLHLLPIINEFMRLNDEVEVRLLLTNHMLDMLEEHVDMGIRIGSQVNSSMKFIRAARMRQVVCASPAYLAIAGHPSTPDDLFNHETVTFSKSCAQIPWSFKLISGKTTELLVSSKLIVNTAEAAVDSALQQVGITQLYYYQAVSEFESGELEIVLEEYELDPLPVNIILPLGSRNPQKVEAFMNFLVPELRKRLQ